MRVNRDAVRAICCRAWAKMPAEYDKARGRGEITVSAVVAQCKLAMLESPLAAEALIEWILPGVTEAKKQRKANETNLQSIAFLKRIRDGRTTTDNS